MMKTLRELDEMITDYSPKEYHPTYWGAALCGEAGEAANLLKKLERDGLASVAEYLTSGRSETAARSTIYDRQIFAGALGEELVDILIYIFLTVRRFPDINLEQSFLDKIEKINKRISDQQA